MSGPALGTGIVGSLTVELERSYRIMLLKVAMELTIENCQQIAFVAKLPSPTCVSEPGKPVNLHMMNTLESLGQIGPLKLDFLEEMLDAIGKNCLLEIIESYKKSCVYKEAKKRLDDQEKKKKRSGLKKPKPPFGHGSSASVAGCSPEAQELLAMKADITEKVCKLKESYATFLTQFSQMALLLRSAIESDDLTQMEDTFVSVASDGDAITRTLRRNLSAAGIKCGSDSCSSVNSTGKISTPSLDVLSRLVMHMLGMVWHVSSLFFVLVTSPTDSEVNPLGIAGATHSPAHSPPRAVRMETQHHFHHTTGPTVIQEGSPSPSVHRKKPIPLPRKKWPAQPESSSGAGVPVSSPTFSPRVSTKFVYCQQESQAPASALNTALLHIPHSASTSCLTCSSEYSGDYSGDYTGTGDSGVGDVRSKYTPSQEALDRKC